MTGSHLLQTIVTHRSRGPQSIRNIAFVDNITLLGGVSPHPGKAVCLKFQSDGKRVSLLRIGALESRNLGLYAQQFLHVMPDFMGDHVSLGELAGSAKAAA